MVIKSVHDTAKADDGIVDWVPAMYTALYVYRASKQCCRRCRCITRIREEDENAFSANQHSPEEQRARPTFTTGTSELPMCS